MSAFLDRLRALTRNQQILIGVGVAVVVVLVAALVVAGGGGGGEEAVATTTTSTTEATTTTTEPPVAPLTGMPAEGGVPDRPALVVKVDNTAKAMAVHEGLDKADIVFVEQVEQGVTRLAAVFHSTEAVVGPVRSGRTSDVDLFAQFQHPLLAYSGANSGVLREIRASSLIDFGVDNPAVTRIYTSNQRGSGLLRFFLPTNDLWAAAPPEAGRPVPAFSYSKAGAAPVGEPATGINVAYGGGAATAVHYEWNGSGWERSQYGRPHNVAGSGRVAPANVVVLFTNYRDSGYRDTTGAVSPAAISTGEGEAWVLSNGRVQRGRWVRPSADQPAQLLDASNTPILLTPGRTWVELPEPGNATLVAS